MWPPGPAASLSMARTRRLLRRSVSLGRGRQRRRLRRLIVGAPEPRTAPALRRGESYVVFGKASGFAAEIDLAALAAGNGGFVIHGEEAGDQSRPFGLRGRRRERRRLRRPHHRAPDGDGPATARVPATAMWCSARRRGFAADDRPRRRSTAATAASSSRASVATMTVRHLGLVGRRRERRRLRRPDHRGACATAPTTAATVPAKAMWCSARPRASRADDRSRRARRRRHQGFVIQGEDAGVRPAGFSVSSAGDVNGDGFDDLIIGAYARRPGDGASAGDSYVVFGKAVGLRRRRSTSPRSPPATAPGFIIHGERRVRPGRLYGLLGRATSTATASTT